MASSSRLKFAKPYLARAFLLVSAPLWIPRLLFCFLIEFWRFHWTDWLVPQEVEVRRSSALTVLPGGKLEHLPLSDGRRNTHLRVIGGKR